jgi:CheY-like chemotaxis protein
MLQQLGYDAHPVLRGGEAVDLALVGQPDVILLDLCMPDVTGWDVVDRLREEPTTRDIPIVVMSGLSPQDAPSLRGRIDGWVSKPASPSTLAEAVYAALRGRGRPRSLLVIDPGATSSSLLQAQL